MSQLPAFYDETLELIMTLRSLPTTGCGSNCGYTSEEIFTQHNALFPGTALTLDETSALLQFNAKRGVFLLGGCASGATTEQTCLAQTLTADNAIEHQTYYINSAMASLNPRNNAFVAVNYNPDPTQPRLSYLPCGFCAGGGVGANYYSGSGSTGGKLNAIGGRSSPNSGTPASGSGCPSFLSCGTCNQ